MRIKVSTLRRLIKEVALSPSLPKNNKTIDDPLRDTNVMEAVKDVGHKFEQALMMDLVLRAFSSHYNSQTRDFDDAAYESIKATAEKSAKDAVTKTASILRNEWKSAQAPASKQKAA